MPELVPGCWLSVGLMMVGLLLVPSLEDLGLMLSELDLFLVNVPTGSGLLFLGVMEVPVSALSLGLIVGG